MANHDDEHDDDHGHGGGGGHKKHSDGGHGHGGGDDHGGGGHGAPLWVVSFCDMTILEMSFFIILLSGASQKTSLDSDMLKILASVKAGFGYVPKQDSKDDLDLAVLQVLAHRQSKGNVASGRNTVMLSQPAMPGQLMKDPDIFVKVKGLMGDPILFPDDSAEIPMGVEQKLDSIAALVRTHFKQVVIQGHVSPAEADRDPKGGHDLAFRRAVAVKKALEARGVQSSRLRLVSCAGYDTFKESQANIQRRVVVTLGTYYLPGAESLEDVDPNAAITK